MPRDRKGSQLSFEVAPELLERLRAHAATERRTVAALLRSWIEAGLAAEPSGGDAPGLAASLEELRGTVELGSARLSRCMNGQAELLQRLGALEAAVAQLQQQPSPVAPAGSVKRLAVVPEPASPDRGNPDPSAGGGITTAELAERTGTNRSAWNNWARDKNPGAVRHHPEAGSWRLVARVATEAGGPPRTLWEPA
jgi:hypothetical protein